MSISYTCKYPGCGREFRFPFRLDQHQEICEKGGNSPHTCAICGSKYLNFISLEDHIISKHGDEAPKFDCSQCPKTYNRRSSLLYHIRRHHSEERQILVKLHQCDICSETFDRYGILKHKKIHHGVKFKCDQCDNVYSHKKHLSEHKQVNHSGLERVKCSLCTSTFTKKHFLNIHLNNVHKIGKNSKKLKRQTVDPICSKPEPVTDQCSEPINENLAKEAVADEGSVVKAEPEDPVRSVDHVFADVSIGDYPIKTEDDPITDPLDIKTEPDTEQCSDFHESAHSIYFVENIKIEVTDNIEDEKETDNCAANVTTEDRIKIEHCSFVDEF